MTASLVSRRLRRTALVALALGAVFGAATGVRAQDAPADLVVATLNGAPISQSDLAAAAAEFADQLGQVPAEQRQAALVEIIVNMRLAAAAAKAEGLDKNPLVVKRVNLVKDRALYAEYLREKFAAQVTEAAAQQRFAEETAKFVPQDEVHAKHILVKTEDEAKAIIAELDKGGDFATLASTKSEDSGSGKDGGDLGFFGRGRMVKPFEDAAFSLEPGQYTKTPVQSDFGWHVILVVEKRKSQPPTFESQAQRIQQDLVRETFDKEIAALRANAKIEVVPPPAPPADASAPAADNPAPAQAAPAPKQ